MDIEEPLPPADEQRRIIAGLEDQEESVHVYYVSKDWYGAWQAFVDTSPAGGGGGSDGVPSPVSAASASPAAGKPLPTSATSATSPGPMRMDADDENNNMLVDEKVWKMWLQWYGIADTHQLDRRNWASDEKDFEVCVLSPYSGIVEHPTKTLDISEEAGYIELQLRKLFRIPEHRKTRLWVCEQRRHARFQLLRKRHVELCLQDKFDNSRDYILAIEVANNDFSWPSNVPGEPIGFLDKYKSLVAGRQAVTFWETELASALDTLFQGISSEFKDTVDGIMQTTKYVSEQETKEALSAKERLREKLKSVEEHQKTVDARQKDIEDKERRLHEIEEKVKVERRELAAEKAKLEEEEIRMAEYNKSSDSRLKLDVGGHQYTTSTLTLTKDANSMFAAMFSGRHSLKREQDGSYFIDRDGTHFRYILNYLRDDGFRENSLPDNRGILTELRTEAQYYQLNGLVQLLDQMLQRLDDDSEEREPSSVVKSSELSPYQKKIVRKVACKR